MYSVVKWAFMIAGLILSFLLNTEAFTALPEKEKLTITIAVTVVLVIGLVLSFFDQPTKKPEKKE